MFTAIPNTAGEHGFGRAIDVAKQKASGAAWRHIPRVVRPLLAEGLPSPGNSYHKSSRLVWPCYNSDVAYVAAIIAVLESTPRRLIPV
jgi:hypothetical protein